MPGIIIVGGQEVGTNTDILQGSRLQTVPKNGFLLFEIAASDFNATDTYSATIQLPSGDTPVTAVPMPQGGQTAGVAGILDDRLAFRTRFRIGQGGHCVFSCIETGDSEMTWRVTFTPAAIVV